MSIGVDIRSFLVAESTVPANATFIHTEPNFSELNNSAINLLYTVTPEVGNDNPKYARGNQFVNFRVRGRNKTHTQACETAAYNIYNKLLGHPNVQIGNVVYTQFNSFESPRFSGYYEGSEPIFTFTLNITKESQVNIGNRLAF